ncbi:MAG TPA: hypothetical protein PKL11_00870 [Anaerolineaceae bacterium]|mgnify:FL=1|nr:hypothetical protein [Anaerolineaceae bacterium]
MLQNQSRVTAIMLIGLGYVLKFISYSFLTAVVLIGFTGLVFIYINVVGTDMSVLKYFGFLLPLDANGSGSITEKDIMRVYGVLSMGLFGVSVLWDWLKRWIKRSRAGSEPANVEVNVEGEGVQAPRRRLPNVLKRILISSVLITLIYVAVFVVIPSAPMATGENPLLLYPIMIIFLIIALIANVIFIGIDTAANKLINLGLSNLINQ